jgi:hypothetical protein
MRRFALLLFVVVLLSSAVVLSRPSASAQEATPPGMAAMAEHPVVGHWRYENVLGDLTFPSYAIFHADGTYVEALPNGAFLLGLWQPTGERTADLTYHNTYFIDPMAVEGEGRVTVEVDETGNAMTQEGTFVGIFEDGSVDMAVEVQSHGTRMEVLPVVPLGTPVVPSDLVAEGTPTP